MTIVVRGTQRGRDIDDRRSVDQIRDRSDDVPSGSYGERVASDWISGILETAHGHFPPTALSSLQCVSPLVTRPDDVTKDPGNVDPTRGIEG